MKNMDIPRTCLPQIGAQAPDFEALTTFGDIKLSDFRGKWVVLFSHPGDFTPVCTTEFIAFARYFPHFVERNTQLIGLSVDSNPSHLAWVYNIYCHTGIEIPFPVIDDRSLNVSNLYGMISPATSDVATVRTVYVIDPDGVLRTILYYPLTIGRSIPEILRILDALQMADANQVATPADWMPGMPVIVPPPKTYDALKQRVKNEDGYSCMDWYLCFDGVSGKDKDKDQC